MGSDKNQAKTASSESHAKSADRLDAVFIGSSAAYRYIIPALIWKDAGITSCVVGSPAQPFTTVPSIIKKSESSLHPTLYIIEIRRLVMKDIEKENNSVKEISAANPTYNNATNDKSEADLNYNNALNDKNVINKFIGSILNPSTVVNKTNNNSQNLSLTDQENLYEEAMTVGSSKQQLEWDPSAYKTDKTPLRKDSEAALLNLLDLCKRKKLHVLFVSTTYVESKLSVTRENYVADRIKSYGFPYLNYNYSYQKIGINFFTDFYDSRHVNTLGAVKITNFLARYIKKNYSFTHKYTRSTDASWNNNYKRWTTLEQEQEKEIYTAINN
jgi:hypothetical protein